MEKELEKAWDELVVSVFTGSNRAFYGSLLCSLDLKWDETIPTAALTSDMEILWNPQFFLRLSKETRKFILLHEIEHVARLHMIRKGEREHKAWVQACDYEINLAQVDEGLTYEGTSPLISEEYRGMTAEQIYDLIQQKKEDGGGTEEDENGSWGDGSTDMVQGENGGKSTQSELTQAQVAKIINTVAKAVQAEKISGFSTDKTQAFESILNKFLKPSLDWNKFLRRYMTDKLKKQLTWKRRNKRFPDVYLPTRRRDKKGLTNITFYLDTSGSITNKMVEIFNSEVKYVFEHFQPKSLNVVQFDTDIRHEIQYNRGTRIKQMKVSGRGGTNLACVHEHIMKTKPNIVVVLSDLDCFPMHSISGPDILWLVFDNPNAQVNQGRVFHVSTRN